MSLDINVNTLIYWIRHKTQCSNLQFQVCVIATVASQNVHTTSTNSDFFSTNNPSWPNVEHSLEENENLISILVLLNERYNVMYFP